MLQPTEIKRGVTSDCFGSCENPLNFFQGTGVLRLRAANIESELQYNAQKTVSAFQNKTVKEIDPDRCLASSAGCFTSKASNNQRYFQPLGGSQHQFCLLTFNISLSWAVLTLDLAPKGRPTASLGATDGPVCFERRSASLSFVSISAWHAAVRGTQKDKPGCVSVRAVSTLILTYLTWAQRLQPEKKTSDSEFDHPKLSD